LSGENSVKPFERNGAFPVEEVGDVGLLETRLSRKTCAREIAMFDTTEKFEAEKFMKILKIHKMGFS
jgi:hypothetical protein